MKIQYMNEEYEGGGVGFSINIVSYILLQSSFHGEPKKNEREREGKRERDHEKLIKKSLL